jgi:hypothetical protein
MEPDGGQDAAVSFQLNVFTFLNFLLTADSMQPETLLPARYCL